MIRDTTTREIALFKVGEDNYGIGVECIQEINRNREFTTVYNAPDYVRGVMNLRGQIVTIIDLRRKLNYTDPVDGKDSRVLIVHQQDESVGLLVDHMDDIVEIRVDDIEPGVARKEGVSNAVFEGILKMQGSLAVILNVAQLLDDEESGGVIA